MSEVFAHNPFNFFFSADVTSDFKVCLYSKILPHSTTTTKLLPSSAICFSHLSANNEFCFEFLLFRLRASAANATTYAPVFAYSIPTISLTLTLDTTRWVFSATHLSSHVYAHFVQLAL